MKRIIIALCIFPILTGCWHEYYGDVDYGDHDNKVRFEVYYNKATDTYEMKIGNKYYPIAISNDGEEGVLSYQLKD